MTDIVSVPRELLREVLATAYEDSLLAQMNWATSEKYRARCLKERARINELRKAAGLEE